jgi:small subunit ribosomal protein S19
MPRSLKKGYFVDDHLMKKVTDTKAAGGNTQGKGIKTWSRRSTVTPDMVGLWFSVHNGKDFISFLVAEEMVGHKMGEFSPTTKFRGHGGKNAK